MRRSMERNAPAEGLKVLLVGVLLVAVLGEHDGVRPVVVLAQHLRVPEIINSLRKTSVWVRTLTGALRGGRGGNVETIRIGPNVGKTESWEVPQPRSSSHPHRTGPGPRPRRAPAENPHPNCQTPLLREREREERDTSFRFRSFDHRDTHHRDHRLCELQRGALTKTVRQPRRETEFLVDNPLVRIHYMVAMIRWTGLAP